MNHRRRRQPNVLASLLILAWPAAAAGPRSGAAELQVEPGQPGIEFTLGATFHTIEGSLTIAGGTVQFDPASGAMSGRLVADATSAQTGNDSRDRKMHSAILESATYPEIAFTPTRFTGTIPKQGETDVVISGILEIHGGRHEVEAPVHVQVEGDAVSGTAGLTIPYVAWGMKNPSAFVLRVEKQVQVTVAFTGRLLAAEQAPLASAPDGR